MTIQTFGLNSHIVEHEGVMRVFTGYTRDRVIVEMIRRI